MFLLCKHVHASDMWFFNKLMMMMMMMTMTMMAQCGQQQAKGGGSVFANYMQTFVMDNSRAWRVAEPSSAQWSARLGYLVIN